MSARIRRCSDSSFENPRSRKTFPVEGVTLTAFPFAMLFLQLRYRAKPLAGGPQIVRARLLRLFLECVKDVNRVNPHRQVEHPVFPGGVNPNLTNARSNRLHGLPIVRFKS